MALKALLDGYKCRKEFFVPLFVLHENSILLLVVAFLLSLTLSLGQNDIYDDEEDELKSQGSTQFFCRITFLLFCQLGNPFFTQCTFLA